ncbi:uncharacterized protein CDAR_421511 [Caerostris darwini]|uniref:Uncharacterized protein n=1 Tax=Caerostris darwini TaxID=1538125 RepID=A0AAV4SUK3_9ARAC|nr:uncharacterized protein CDAR_421511 [Caerostris darwini]
MGFRTKEARFKRGYQTGRYRVYAGNVHASDANICYLCRKNLLLILKNEEGATASKLCSENGTWWVHPDLNQTWSNYSLCGNVVPFQDEGNVFVVHIPVIKAISQAGYSVSLTLLLIACLLLGSVRRLRCPRNNLHLQLFASFILRASVSLFRDMTYGSNINEVIDLL